GAVRPAGHRVRPDRAGGAQGGGVPGALRHRARGRPRLAVRGMTAPWPGTAVMTGASRGIGRALAVGLAQRVERVVLLGRDVEGLRETAAGCACAKVE